MNNPNPEEGERPGTQVEGEEPIVLMRRRDPNGYFDQFGYEWWMPIEGDRATPSRAVEAGHALGLLEEAAICGNVSDYVRRQIREYAKEIRAALSSQTAGPVAEGEPVAYTNEIGLACLRDQGQATVWRDGDPRLGSLPLFLRHLSNSQQGDPPCR